MTSPTARLVPVERLTARQREVLQLLARGCRYQDIATVLHVSRDTVKTDARSAIRLLQARNRTHAVAVAIRAGVIA